MDVIESRNLYSEEVDGVTITVRAMMEEDDGDPRDDGDWATDADVTAWQNDEWRYVAFVVAVELNHTAVGSGSIGSVAHGTLGEDPDREGVVNEVDAWDFTVPEYGHRDGRDWVSMGSALNGGVVEALDSAEQWLSSIGMAETSLLINARKWADPNATSKGRPSVTLP